MSDVSFGYILIELIVTPTCADLETWQSGQMRELGFARGQRLVPVVPGVNSPAARKSSAGGPRR